MPKFKRALLARAVSPLWRSVADDAEGSDEGTAAAVECEGEAAADDGEEDDKGFPSGTAVKDMTPEQSAAYWRHETKKQERIVKETQADLKKAKDDLDEIRREKLTEQERAVEDAKQEGRTEGEASVHAANQRAFAIYELRLRGLSEEEAGEMVELLDLSKLTREDGAIDGDRLDSLAQRSTVRSPGGSRGRGFGYAPDGNRSTSLSHDAYVKRAEEIKNKNY